MAHVPIMVSRHITRNMGRTAMQGVVHHMHLFAMPWLHQHPKPYAPTPAQHSNSAPRTP